MYSYLYVFCCLTKTFMLDSTIQNKIESNRGVDLLIKPYLSKLENFCEEWRPTSHLDSLINIRMLYYLNVKNT